jgi:predicted transcriptional regulator
MGKVLSTKVDDELDRALGKISDDLKVSKSWIVQQALRQYIERYDESLSDLRIASLGKTIPHEDVLREHGL